MLCSDEQGGKNILGLLDSVVIKPMFCKLSQICVNISSGLQWSGLAKFLGHFLLLAMRLRFDLLLAHYALLLQAVGLSLLVFLKCTPQVSFHGEKLKKVSIPRIIIILVDNYYYCYYYYHYYHHCITVE